MLPSQLDDISLTSMDHVILQGPLREGFQFKTLTALSGLNTNLKQSGAPELGRKVQGSDCKLDLESASPVSTWFCLKQAVRLRTSHFTSLSLGFPFCRMGDRLPTP